jgi:hypothetical protein
LPTLGPELPAWIRCDRRGLGRADESAASISSPIDPTTRLPYAPSVFAELPDGYDYDPRPRLNFLHKISGEISRPIARDDRVHVEYVPTQIVTEYVRTAVRINRRKVDGIRYNSSRKNAKTALVLFADQDDLILEKPERPDFYRLEGRWLRLAKANGIHRLPVRCWLISPFLLQGLGWWGARKMRSFLCHV